MNPFEAVAIIIAVFFIAGLMVGFLIVMALPALVGRRSSDRMGFGAGTASVATSGGRTRDQGTPAGWPEPRPWPGTRPFGTGPDGDDPDGEDDDTGDQCGPPDRPWGTGGRY